MNFRVQNGKKLYLQLHSLIGAKIQMHKIDFET